MSNQLLTYLTRCGGEYMNSPMAHSDKIDEVDILEIRENTQTGAMEVTTLPKLSFAALRDLINREEKPDRGFVLRIACIPLLIEGSPWVIGLKKQYYNDLLDMFGLRQLRDFAHTSPMTFDVLPQRVDDRVVGVQYSVHISNYIGLYFTYKHLDCAWGVFWSHGHLSPHPRVRTANLLRMALNDFSHLAQDPFYLLFSYVLCLLSSVDQRLARVRKKVAVVEAHTGYQDWGHLTLPEGLPDSQVELHLPRYSAEMSGAITTLASDRRMVRISSEMVAVIKQSEWLTSLVPKGPNQPLQVQLASDIVIIEARLRNHLLLIDIIEARVRSQLSAVQNLVARHEMRLSIRIAHDSKTLANSMKILAILTVVFLPATFVASLFSTSMFDWHLSEDDFVSTKFWIYWVVSIPLTIATVIVFYLLSRRWSRLACGPDEEAARYMLEGGDNGTELTMVDSYATYLPKGVDSGVELTTLHNQQSRL